MAGGENLGKLQREPFQEGEPIIVIEPKGKKHYLQLRRGDKFHHVRTGHIAHDQIIGRSPGVLLKSDRGLPVVCLRLTLEDYILKKLQRRTSIIHPKDLATLLVRGDLYPGARVVEAGIGSGATALMLLRYLGPSGFLISYERRQEFIDLARSNLLEANNRFGDPGTGHEIRLGDVYDGIDASDLDLVILDVPEPDRTVSSAYQALRPGGTLLCWLPTVTQVYGLVMYLQSEAGWAVVETRETVERSWDVALNAMRPFHRMVAHTGFLIRARKLAQPQGGHCAAQNTVSVKRS